MGQYTSCRLRLSGTFVVAEEGAVIEKLFSRKIANRVEPVSPNNRALSEIVLGEAESKARDR